MESINKDQKLAILQERARLLALTSDFKDNPIGECLQVVKFILGNETYCIDTSFIREILSVKEVTPLPGTPTFIEGIINVRGHMVPIINPFKIFQVKINEMIVMNKIIILEIPDQQKEFGIIVEAVLGTSEIVLNELNPIPQNLSGSGASYIQGISPDGIIVIDALSFITSSALIVNQTDEHKF